jgi:hypothetical protein
MYLATIRRAGRRVGAPSLTCRPAWTRQASSFAEEDPAHEGGGSLAWWLAGVLGALLASPVAVSWCVRCQRRRRWPRNSHPPHPPHHLPPPCVRRWGRRQHAQLRARLLAWDPHDDRPHDAPASAPPSPSPSPTAPAPGEAAALRQLARAARLGVRVEYLTLMLLRTWGACRPSWYQQVLAHVATRQLDVDLLAAAVDMHAGQWDAAARPLMAALGHAVAHQKLMDAAAKEGWTQHLLQLQHHADGLAQLRRHGFYRRIAVALDWLALAAPQTTRLAQPGSARPAGHALLMDALLMQYPDTALSPAAVQVAAGHLGPGEHTAQVPLDQLLGAVVGPDWRHWGAAAALQALEDGAVAPSAAHVALGLARVGHDAGLALALRYATAGGAGSTEASAPSAWRRALGGWGGDGELVTTVQPAVGRGLVHGVHASPATVAVRFRVVPTDAVTRAEDGRSLAGLVAGSRPYDAAPPSQRYRVELVSDLGAELLSALARMLPAAVPGDRWASDDAGMPRTVTQAPPLDAGTLDGVDALYRDAFALWPAPTFTAHPRTVAAMVAQSDDAARAVTLGSEISHGTGELLEALARGATSPTSPVTGGGSVAPHQTGASSPPLMTWWGWARSWLPAARSVTPATSGAGLDDEVSLVRRLSCRARVSGGGGGGGGRHLAVWRQHSATRRATGLPNSSTVALLQLLRRACDAQRPVAPAASAVSHAARKGSLRGALRTVARLRAAQWPRAAWAAASDASLRPCARPRCHWLSSTQHCWRAIALPPPPLPPLSSPCAAHDSTTPAVQQHQRLFPHPWRPSRFLPPAQPRASAVGFASRQQGPRGASSSPPLRLPPGCTGPAAAACAG